MIRFAQPNDAASVVPLLYGAMGEIGLLLTGTDNENDAMDAMRAWFQDGGNRLSHENVIVEERDGVPVGAALMYDGARVDALDEPLLERAKRRLGVAELHFPRESREDEYYLDALAVNPAYRGAGIGTSLMQAFEAEAVRLGHGKAALIVLLGNERARRLYEAQGYAADGQLVILGHLYEHRVKRLVNG